MKKLLWTSRQVDRLLRNALKGEQYYIRQIEGARNRAIDFACGMADAEAELRAENERLLTENQQLKDMIEALRWRTFTLLRSSDAKAEIFGLPKYTLDGLDAVRDVEPDADELEELRQKYQIEKEDCGL